MSVIDSLHAPTGRCYRCFRPQSVCYCASIPRIENRTDVLILQHMRERFHPFNTARLLHMGLGRSTLLVDHTPQLAHRLTLHPRAGLLYPGDDATLIADVPPALRPEQLVVLDGTWHHAKTLLRDIPRLQALPRFKLLPTAPSEYRIRREPTATALSTLEATIAALRILEPDTNGLDRLLRAFTAMIDQQLAHPKSPTGWRQNRRRRPQMGNIPRAILGELAHVVTVCAESTLVDPDGASQARVPVCWVAERVGTGERFARLIEPPRPLPAELLAHLELSAEQFCAAEPLEVVRHAWCSFLRPSDTLAVYNQSVIRLFPHLHASPPSHVVLKGIEIERTREIETLTETLTTHEFGRASRRLSTLTALVRRLHGWSAQHAEP
ncbi:MAG: DTW domain-containing protein [Planctomycetaceae bacterium]|nr:DTW domain-containing protein [Planctomycetaceae bacterium]